ncbi:putative porin [Sphingomonas sp. QA11]|uniref:putative porin n=1 Tax=Sphingomonas sp. QA11 TaxID=2950605 RepID=UPI00234A117B|nr:putative porin [Sphingomonas sp. QA11]WCM25950.1 putative porin [Sphingomonas sp. QA11]
MSSLPFHRIKRFVSSNPIVSRALVAALLGATALTATPALAQDAAAPSDNPTINLVNALVKKGILGRAEADTMIAQAQTQADQVKAAMQAAQTAQTSAQTAVAAASPASAQPGTSVRYVPQFVRDQIREEVRNEVLADAKTQGLVAPDAMPDWVRGIKISGDFRFRDEAHLFDKGNATDFLNIGTINSGKPADFNDPANQPPIRNTTANRNYLRIRARLGIEATIAPQITFYGRLATGMQNNPDSTNQNLGGYFTDKGIWLDRAYVDIHPFKGEDAHLFLGRMANPFHLTELVWDKDVNLDGAALSYSRRFGGGLSGFIAGGAFPLDYAPDDDPQTSVAKTGNGTATKWLFAGQAGLSWQATSKLTAELDGAYYVYSNVAGRLSPACYNTSAYCLTDSSRPGYQQAGNTLFAIRDLTTTDPTNQAIPQYFGLASRFRVLDASGALTYDLSDDLRLDLTGHYSRNLAYNASEILARGYNATQKASQIINNVESCPAGGIAVGCFKSGGDAWMVRATLGSSRIVKFGDWQITGSYRYIQPDALLDAFTDQDFHQGGTNARGWTIGGEYGVFRNTSFGLRWMSGQEVFGPPLKIDLVQADLNVHF